MSQVAAVKTKWV